MHIAVAVMVALSPLLRAQERVLIQVPVRPPVPAPEPVGFADEEPGCGAPLAQAAGTWWRVEGDRFWARPPLAIGVGQRAAIVDDLRTALAADTDGGVYSLLLALGSIGGGDREVGLSLRAALHDHDLGVRISAAIALGLTRQPDVIPTLLSVFTDRNRFNGLRDAAAWGVALALEGEVVAAAQNDVLRAGAVHLRGDEVVDIELDTAAVLMLRALRPGRDAALRDAALAVLWEFHDRPDPARIRVRAHVASAVARLLADGGDPGGSGRRRLCAALARGDDHVEWPLGVGAAQALGALCEGKPDAEVEAALTAYARRGRNPHARGMARLALGRIGSESAVRGLLAELAGGSDEFHRAWAATAAGWAAGRSPHLDAGLREEVRATLLATLGEMGSRNFDVRALALGLSGHPGAVSALARRDGVWRNRHDGVAAVEALALLRAPEAVVAARAATDLLVRREALDEEGLFAALARVRARMDDPELAADLRRVLPADDEYLDGVWGAMRALPEAGATGLADLRAALASSCTVRRELAAIGLAQVLAGGSPLATIRRDLAYRFAPYELRGRCSVLANW